MSESSQKCDDTAIVGAKSLPSEPSQVGHATVARSDFFTEQSLSDWASLQARLDAEPGVWLYRGQGDRRWPLATSLERLVRPRENRLVAEEASVRRFSGPARLYLPSERVPLFRLEWLALMQHHRVPTRLLDWTRSPYVALYFAFSTSPEDADSVALWAIDRQFLSIMQLKATAHLYRLAMDRPKLAETLAWHAQRGVRLSWDEARTDTSEGSPLGSPEAEEEAVKKLRLVISGLEHSHAHGRYFDAIMDVADYGQAAVFEAEPFFANERMYAQQAVSLFPCDASLPFEENLTMGGSASDPKRVLKLVLPKVMKADVLKRLAQMNITEATLFPGLDGLGVTVKNHVSRFDRPDAVADPELRAEYYDVETAALFARMSIPAARMRGSADV